MNLGWHDPTDLIASMRDRLADFKRSPDIPGLWRLSLREQRDDKWYRLRSLARWPEMASVLDRYKRLLRIDYGLVWLEMLDPNTTLPWTVETSDYARVHLALRTNPACLNYCGVEARHLGLGWLVSVTPGLPCSAINLGDWQRVHLVAEFRANRPAEGRDHESGSEPSGVEIQH
jgi:hypothetical protein